MKKITIFFGEMGCGKSYCGARYAQKHGYHFFEGDSVVPPAMMERVSKFQPLTKEMVEEYIGVLSDTIADKMLDLEKEDRFNFEGLVVSQALYRDEHRHSLTIFLESLGYHVRWRWVKVPFWRNIQNLLTRPSGWKWVYYWLINKPFFQKPTHDHYVFYNIYER